MRRTRSSFYPSAILKFDEKFFDAQEISVDEWAKSTKAEFLGGQPDPTALEGAGWPAVADLLPFDVKKTEVVCQ